MGFRSQRGRPRKPKEEPLDRGTKELQQKRRVHLTQEPLDALLHRNIISGAEHQAGMHFRWLYTLCHGSPLPESYDVSGDSAYPLRQDCPLWRQQREEEYRHVALLLQSVFLLRAVQNCCVYLEPPPDAVAQARLQQGLEKLVKFWGKKKTPSFSGEHVTKAVRYPS